MSNKILLRNVILHWPFIFDRSVWKGRVSSYRAWLVIPPSEVATANIAKSAVSKAKERMDEDVEEERSCLRDEGSANPLAYEPDTWVLRTSANNKPVVIDANKKELTEQGDIELYGALANAVVDVWAYQKGQYEPRICATLHAVQILKEGEGMGEMDDSPDRHRTEALGMLEKDDLSWLD